MKRSGALCGAPADIRTQPLQSDQPAGAFLRQLPAAATIYSCGMPLTRFVAAPLPPPPPPAAFPIGDLSTPAGINKLQSQVQRTCDGGTLNLQTGWTASNLPKSAFVDQSPDPNATYSCGQTVVVYRSLGPPPPFQVGELSDPAAIDTFRAQVSQACGQPPSLQKKAIASTLPTGAYAGQDPAPEAVYTCGEMVTLWTAVRPEVPQPRIPWWVLAGGGALAGVGGWTGWRWLHPTLGVRPGVPRWSVLAKAPIQSLVPDVELTVEGASARAAVRGDLVILG